MGRGRRRILTNEQRLAYKREWYDRNKSRLKAQRLARQRERYAAEPEFRAKQIAAQKRWQSENPEIVYQQKKRHYAKNRARLRAEGREKALRRYGITGDHFTMMLIDQDYCCAICGSLFDLFANRRGCSSAPHVDHCHRTGVVRGLLCSRCNFGIGLMGDSPERMVEAARYVSQRAAGVV